MSPKQSHRKTMIRIMFIIILILSGIFLFDFLSQQGSTKDFTDEFNRYNADRWKISGPWGNGVPFLNSWREDHMVFTDGILRIRLDDTPCATDPTQCAGRPYASGEYRSKEIYHYGCFESRFKTVQEDGVVTSLFIYSGELPNLTHDEIDIEILGNDPTKMQINYFTNGISHPKMIDLGFNAASAFHEYAIEWTRNNISWYVDGVLFHTEDGSNGDLPQHAGYIMMNLWPVDETAVGWAGEFHNPGVPIYAEYDWFKFSESPCK